MENLDLIELAEKFNGEYIEKRQFDHDGSYGDIFVFYWDDETNIDDFVEECKNNEIDIVNTTLDFENGVLTACVMVDHE